MAQQHPGSTMSFTAAADYSACQYHIVKVSSSGTATLASAGTDFVVGTIQNEPTSGESLSVVMSGTAKVLAGGSISIGDRITSDASGHGVATTTSGNLYIGVALQAADSGDVIEYAVGLGKVWA